MALPTGWLTFLFTDIEGSTRILTALGESYPTVHADHQAIVRAAVAAHDGTEVSTEGDAFFVVFRVPLDALRCAVAVQRGLADHTWPIDGEIRVRVGIHTGQAVLAGDDYVGLDINRAARIANAANGGQIVLSDGTRSAAGQRLPDGLRVKDLGRHRLKDVGVQRLWQLEAPGLFDDFGPPRSLEAHPTNLPVEQTSLFGRDADADTLTALLHESPLVTVTGVGGIGKSRLAVHVARSIIDEFPDGVFYVDAAPHQSIGPFLSDMAAAIGIRLPTDGDPVQSLLEQLVGRSALLVIDTVDRLTGFGPLASRLLAGCTSLRILATCRSPIHVIAEREYPLRALDFPSSRGSDAAALAASPAIQLFVDRARAVRPQFALTASNAVTIAAVVTRLDGLPLAIELAAARSRLLAPGEILARLEQRLPVLHSGAVDAPERQRTMTATIEWSYESLDQEEATLLQRLSVFADVFDLDAAIDVCVAPDTRPAATEVVDTIERLIDRSLVATIDRGTRTELRLLGLIREFAAERAIGSPEAGLIRLRHARHFLKVAETAAATLDGPHQLDALAELDRIADDIRAALGWLLADPTQSVDEGDHLALRTSVALGRAWYLHGRAREAVDYLDRALAADTSAPPELIADALHLSGVMHDELRDPAVARERLEASLALQRSIGNGRRIARELNSLGVVARNSGDTDRATALLEESLAMRRALGDEPGTATTLSNLGVVAIDLGRYDVALVRLREAVDLDRATGARGVVAYSSSLLGTVLIRTDERAAGLALIREGLRTFADLGDADGVAECLELLGEAMIVEAPAVAARLLGAADAIRRREGVPIRPPDEAAARRAWTTLEAALDAMALAAAQDEVAAMDVEAATVYALATVGQVPVSVTDDARP